MRTLTLFSAYEIARDESHRLDFEIEFASDADECQRFRIERDRRDRFIASLECAIRARLTPPALQRTSNGDYADDLVNDSEAGRISEDDISSLSAG